MAIWQSREGGPYFYKFNYAGQRYNGACETADKTKALRVQEQKRRLAKQGKLTPAKRRVSARRTNRMTLRDVIGSYRDLNEQDWSQGHKVVMRKAFEDIVESFGAITVFADITQAQVTEFITRRRKDKVRKREHVDGDPGELPITNATVNRTAVQPLRALFIHASKTLGIEGIRMPVWKKLRRREKKVRNRTLSPEKLPGVFEALDPDFRGIFLFSLLTGVRRSDAVGLRWDDIDWTERLITFETKGYHSQGRETHQVDLTAPIEAILRHEWQNHPEVVFTFVCQRGDKGRKQVKGQRYPISATVLRDRWRKVRKTVPGLEELRWHDLRHTFGTWITKQAGIFVAQQLLGHRDIETTRRYVHADRSHLRHHAEQLANPFADLIQRHFFRRDENET